VSRLARLALLVAVLAATAGCGSGSSGSAVSFRGTELEAEPTPDFVLHDQTGAPVQLSKLRGHTVLLTFLYTHCPDVCPLIATNLGAAVRRLGPTGKKVRVLAVSVDPAGDTRTAAQDFVTKKRLPPEFQFLIGTRPELVRVWRSYHIAADQGPENTVNHSAYTLLIDRDGKQRVLYDAQVRPGEVVHDVRALTDSAST
jgi:protein SCO1/2